VLFNIKENTDNYPMTEFTMLNFQYALFEIQELISDIEHHRIGGIPKSTSEKLMSKLHRIKSNLDTEIVIFKRAINTNLIKVLRKLFFNYTISLHTGSFSILQYMELKTVPSDEKNIPVKIILNFNNGEKLLMVTFNCKEYCTIGQKEPNEIIDQGIYITSSVTINNLDAELSILEIIDAEKLKKEKFSYNG